MSLDAFFVPRSIAILGASRNATSMGGTLVSNLSASFRGPLFFVNPHVTTIVERPCFPSILAIPEPVELAIVAVPAAAVLAAVDECLQKQVRAIVIISAGFREVDAEGAQREAALLKRLRAAGVPFVGPNCLGVLNTDAERGLNATFSLAGPPVGNVGICTQSGALGFVFPDYMRRWQLGVAEMVSLGNKADLGENDLLRRWRDEPRVGVIQLYLESFQDPREFLQAARELSRVKPVVALKAGRSVAGQRAASSHTAALASPAAVAQGILRQSGILAVHDLAELFDVTALLALQPLPTGRRTAILTNAGGPGVLAADALEANGLRVPELSTTVRQQLRAILPPQAAVGNPIDLIGSTSPDEYEKCLDLLLDCDEVDNVLVIYVPRLAETSAAIGRAVQSAAARQAMSSASSKRQKTLAAIFLESAPAPAELIGPVQRIPSFSFPESAARALARVAEYAERRKRWVSGGSDSHAGAPSSSSTPLIDECALRPLIDAALASDTGSGVWLDAPAMQQLLSACHLVHPNWALTESVVEALDVCDRLGGPVTLKLVAPSVLHKARAGGVYNDMRTSDEIRAAWRKLMATAPDASGVFIQQFLAGGRELFLGIQVMPEFGPVIAFGLGGTEVERQAQVRFRLLPLRHDEVEDLIDDARVLELFPAEARDVVRSSLRHVLVTVASLATAVPELCEADFNPIKVWPDGRYAAVDARLRVRCAS